MRFKTLKASLPLLVGSLIFFVLGGCNSKGNFPIVGLKKNGKEFGFRLDEKEFQENLAQYLIKVDQTVVPLLNREPKKSSWLLGEVGIGVSFEAGAALGPLFSIKGEAGITAIFSPEFGVADEGGDL